MSQSDDKASDVYERLQTFREGELERLEIDDFDKVNFALARVAKYRRFLDIIAERYFAASEANKRDAQILLKTGRPEVVDDRWRLGGTLVLEIESFYLFAKILLDKVAHFLEFYFGQGRGCSLDSHDGLTKCIAKFADEKGIVLPPELKQAMDRCKEKICDHRDYAIAHEKSPRTVDMLSLDADSDARMALVRAFSTDSDGTRTSESVKDLLTVIDDYLRQTVDLLGSNKLRSRLRSNVPNA